MVDNEKILAGVEALKEFKDKLTELCEEYRDKVQEVCPEDIRTRQCLINENIERLFELQIVGNRGFDGEATKDELKESGFIFKYKCDECAFYEKEINGIRVVYSTDAEECQK